MAELVEIKKGSKKKSVTKAQWDSMVSSKSTYGWTLASDLPAEVLKKDKDVQASVVDKLKDENKDLKAEIAGLKATIGDKDLKINELEEQLKAYVASDEIKSENIKTLEKALENVAPKGTVLAEGSSETKVEEKADKEPAVTESVKEEAKAPAKTDASDVKANTSKDGKKNSGK